VTQGVPMAVTNLLTFIFNQAGGVPTGPHGYFNMYVLESPFLFFFELKLTLFARYHIDSITVGVTNNLNSKLPHQPLPLVHLPRLRVIIIIILFADCQLWFRVIEGTVRSLNNLLEHLHQSFYYYLLPSPNLYLSIGDYMISLGLILLPLLAQV
jgi:glycosylphosphatidylinositol transamidase